MGECPEQWKIDVNERYQAAVSVITSLATAALILPIFFLKDVSSPGSGLSIADSLSCSAYFGWIFLSIAIIAAVVYQYSSAKWVKLAWAKEADMFGIKVEAGQVESALDISYAVMITGFAAGILCMITFMATFSPPAKTDQPQIQGTSSSPQTPSRP